LRSSGTNWVCRRSTARKTPKPPQNSSIRARSSTRQSRKLPDQPNTPRGRPSAEDEPEIVGYGLKGSISADPERVEAAKRTLGKFIIATNELDPQKLSPIQILQNYTGQGVSVERGFRFLKDPLFFADSLFLKKPERIMALMMIMGLALLIYALAERQLRLGLENSNEKIPDQSP